MRLRFRQSGARLRQTEEREVACDAALFALRGVRDPPPLAERHHAALHAAGLLKGLLSTTRRSMFEGGKPSRSKQKSMFIGGR